MRLIDADALLEEMGAGSLPIEEPGISGVTGDPDTIKDYIDRAPTVDASEVVRCKRCVYAMPLTDEAKKYVIDGCLLCSMERGDQIMGYSAVFPDDFCNNGEKGRGDAT